MKHSKLTKHANLLSINAIGGGDKKPARAGKRIRTRLALCLVWLLMTAWTATAQTQRYTVAFNHTPIENVIKELRTKTGYEFVYQKQVVKDVTPITCECNDMTLTGLLNRVIVTEAGIDYEIMGQSIVLRESREVKGDGTKRIIRGHVFDENGEPMMWTSIRVKGSKDAAMSQEDGSFELKVSRNDKATVEFAYIGYNSVNKTFNLKEGNVDHVRIVMHEDNSSLNEVVVTGYQVINKRALTSAVTTIKAEEVMRADALSIDQMLEGHISDLMVLNNSGESGVAPKIRIRGTSSIIGNREPLWVVDGIVVKDPVQISAQELNNPDYVNRIGNAIAGLNPQDIERLDILKDAAATALYGSKAANGVIVITTKRGRQGKPEIRYNNSFTWKMRPRYSDPSVDVMSSKERIQFSRELFDSHYNYDNNIYHVGYEGALMDLYNGKTDFDGFTRQVARMEAQNTDWFDLLSHDSFSQQHTVSMNGGGDKTQYYASVGYVDQDDVVNDQNNKRYTALLNLDTNFTGWLSASFKMQGNVTKRDYYQTSLAPIEYAYTTSRTIPAFDENGDYFYYQKLVNSAEGYNFNMLNELAHSGISQEGNNASFDANFLFRFTDWLTANAIGSYTAGSTDIENYWGDRTYHAAALRDSEYGTTPPSTSMMPQGGEYGKQHTRSNSYTLRLQLDWNKYFGDKHNFNGGIGYEMSSTRYKASDITARGYYPDRGLSFVTDIDSEQFPSYASWAATNQPRLTDNLENNVSAYLTMTYSYNRMVYYNINGRIDGSNQFGKYSNNKFLPIWSTSASFNFGQLDFMKRLDWLDYLTVKASFGYQGNMPAGQSPVMLIRKGSMSSYYNEFTSTINTNPNPNLKWERTNSWNIGLDAAFFDNRLALGASVYFKRTKDAFMEKNVSTVNGMDRYTVNGGNVDNDGWSVDITGVPLRGKNWFWTLSTTFSREINRVRTSPAGERYELDDFLTGNAVVENKAIGTFYSYRFLGLSPVDGGPMFDDWGDHSSDLEGLSKYDTYTRVLTASGSRYPTMSGGLSSSLRYKTVRLSFSLAYSLGAKTRLFGMYGSEATVNGGNATIYNAGNIRPENNASRDYLDRWMRPGDEAHTNIPAIIGTASDTYYKYIDHWSTGLNTNIQQIASNYWDMYDFSDNRVVSASYLKLQNISLAWELPKKWMDRITLKRIELKVSATNLFTICDRDLKGQTPIQGGFTTIQLSDRPTVSFGLDITL